MCSVVGCDSWRRGVERFSLPEDPDRRMEWVQFVLDANGQRLKESSWTEISICGEHFAEDCLESPAVSAAAAAAAAGELRLSSGAVPSQMEGSTEKWTDGEVRDLLSLYGCRELQRGGSRRNLKLYASISEQLAVRGVQRTAKQCREKIKKLKQDYKKVKDQNIRSGYERKTNKWYEEMDAILGHRPEYAGNPAADAAAAAEAAAAAADAAAAAEAAAAADAAAAEAAAAAADAAAAAEAAAAAADAAAAAEAAAAAAVAAAAARPVGIPERGGRGSATATVKTEVTAPDGSEEGILNEAPSASSTYTDCSTPSSPSTCTCPSCPSTSSSKPSTSNTSHPSSPLPRPARKRKMEESGLQRLVKQLLQKDEEDRRASQKTMNQLLAMLREQNAREAEERERQRAEAAEERRRQDAFHKLLGMLLLRLTEATQQPTHPTLD